MPSKTKDLNEEKIEKKTTATKTSTATKAREIKKANVSKKKASASRKTASKKVSSNTKKIKTSKSETTKKNTTSKKTSIKKSAVNVRKISKTQVATSSKKKTSNKMKPLAEVVEYYDLPYRYNETIVKILYQTPNTLFVYWDIADSDREKYIEQYGENFFNITRPVLIVHNITMNYSFEIEINDFANSWYLHINDSKCDYKIELGRRPNYYNKDASKEIQEKIHTDYIYVSISNKIETPNDKVLFNTNENNTIKVRNVKTLDEKSISLYQIIKHLPAMKNVKNIPYISEELLQDIYSGIYQNEDISLFERIKNNPSSGGNPSSGNISSRFI